MQKVHVDSPTVTRTWCMQTETSHYSQKFTLDKCHDINNAGGNDEPETFLN